MLDCVKPSSSSRKPNVQLSVLSKRANSYEGTPRSSTQPSPTVDITREFNLYTQSNSFSEIRSKIHTADCSNEHQESIHVEDHDEPNIDTQILNPSRECVQEALQHTKPGNLACLAGAYFEHSEAASDHCISLLNSIHRARSHYSKLQNLLCSFPLDSDSNALSDTQCDRAFDVFIKFSSLENPFPCPESHNFHNIRNSFSHLNQQLSLSKPHSGVDLLGCTTTSAAVCLVGTAVGITIAAVVIASHALPALVAAPLLPACLLPSITKNEVAHLALDAVARGAYFFHYDLNTIDCLAELLYGSVENDKHFIRLGLAGGCDRLPIHLVAKQLHKNHNDFNSKLVDLEDHVCLCIGAINRTRSKLLEEIHRRRSHFSYYAASTD